MSDGLVETELTPELAAQLLATPHPKQRKTARQAVEPYARAIREGRWRLVRDPLMVVGETHADEDNPLGSMFNGAHRCQAVISAHRAIPVYIDWDADPSTFDLIDIGRKRAANQFVPQTFAVARSGAARMCLWYERRFERPPAGVNLVFDLHEVLAEAERRSASFDVAVPLASRTWEYTGLSVTTVLAAYSLALDFGYEAEVSSFVDGIADPMSLAPTAPARVLSERFRKQSNRARRRGALEDWSILVRALNFHLEGRPAIRLQLSSFWPRVAESEADFNRRRNAAAQVRLADKERAVHQSKITKTEAIA